MTVCTLSRPSKVLRDMFSCIRLDRCAPVQLSLLGHKCSMLIAFFEVVQSLLLVKVMWSSNPLDALLFDIASCDHILARTRRRGF